MVVNIIMDYHYIICCHQKILNNNRWQSTWSSASRDISKNYKSNEMTKKSLVFNYPLEKIAPILDKTLMEEHGYEVVINEKNKY